MRIYLNASEDKKYELEICLDPKFTANTCTKVFLWNTDVFRGFEKLDRIVKLHLKMLLNRTLDYRRIAVVVKTPKIFNFLFNKDPKVVDVKPIN